MSAAVPIPIREPRFYTPAEAAIELKSNVVAVRRLMRAGKLPYVEISKKTRRIPRESIDQLVRKEMLRHGEASWKTW
jgi:excisionase family DNA binding protein